MNNDSEPKTRLSNPALAPLQDLVGMWELELRFPADSDSIAGGHAAFEWLEGGAFLILRLPVEADSPARSIWLIGRDESLDDYTVFYFDLRQVSRIYQMSLTAAGVWKMWRDAPGFSQRFTGAFNPAKTTITARWEKSTDGSTWQHDFDMTFSRVILVLV